MFKLDTQAFTDYQIPEGAHFLKVYLQTHSAESEAVFHDPIDEIGRGFDSEDKQGELDQCVERVWDFLAKSEERAPMPLLICTTTGSMWVRQIDVLLPNAVRWEKYPYWKPLVEAIYEFEPYGVVLLDNKKAPLFEIFLNKARECQNVARKNTENTSEYLNKVVKTLEELIQTECPRRIVLAGERETWAEFLRACPAYLGKSPMKHPSMDASAQQVMELTNLDELAERCFEITQVDELVRLTAAEKKVALGLKNTIDALNHGRISRLIYSENFSARGGHCLICGSEFAGDIELCSKCNVAVRMKMTMSPQRFRVRLTRMHPLNRCVEKRPLA